ncbi:hypothetical protein Kisp01_09790 [Kineosporia sp. NBRC 101677]|uniref:FliO/MopB family protein n=1 Tax=Kineosporia sp. NBRC 101677 TaxID=3032197 RepID=UPI00249FABDF|nr:flagellar biosynthetic protein FliO [Kineosporia sp. NBRC 101677]GLY13963.1 hypothetical protein Kisp01_09790 [Kineosporia sp. NBRC 101677]
MIGDLDQLGRVVGGLIVVLMTIALAARLARRAGGENGTSGLRIVERIGLSREANLAVVEISDRKLLLGVTSQGVTMLADFDDADEAVRSAVQNAAQKQLTGRRSRRTPAAARAGSAGAVADAVKSSLRRQLGLRSNRQEADEAFAGRRTARRGRRSKGFGLTRPTAVPNSEPSFVPGFVPTSISAPENIDAEDLFESELAAQELAAAFGAPATEAELPPSPAAAAYAEEELMPTQPQTSPAPVDALLIDVRDLTDAPHYTDLDTREPDPLDPTVPVLAFEPDHPAQSAELLLESERPVRRSGRRAAGPPRDPGPLTRAQNRASLRDTPAEDEPLPLPDGLQVDEFPDLASALRAAGRTTAEPEPEPAPQPATFPSAEVTGRRAFVPDSPAALIQRPAESLPERTARQVAAFQAEAYPGRRAAGQPERRLRPQRQPQEPVPVPVPGQGRRVAQPQDQSSDHQPAHVASRPSGRRSQELNPQVNGSVLSPRTWRQGVDALRDLTVRRG